MSLNFTTPENDEETKLHAHAVIESDFFGGLDITLPDSTDDIWDMALSEMNRSGIHAARAGYLLTVLRDRLEHGELEEGFKKRGIGTRDGYNLLQIGEALKKVTPEQRKKLLSVGKTKLIELSKLPDETLQDLAEGDGEQTLDDVAKMTTRELQEQVRQLRNKLEVSDMEKEIQADEPKKKVNPWPTIVMEVREESSLAGQTAISQLDEMERLMGEMASPLLTLDKAEKGEAQFSAMASVLFMNLSGIQARAAHLIEAFKQYGWEDHAVNDSETTPLLSSDEAAKVYSDWQMMLQTEVVQKNFRSTARAKKAGAGKRGRPAGSTKSDK